MCSSLMLCCSMIATRVSPALALMMISLGTAPRPFPPREERCPDLDAIRLACLRRLASLRVVGELSVRAVGPVAGGARRNPERDLAARSGRELALISRKRY